MSAPLLATEAVSLRPLCARDEDLYIRLHASARTMHHVSAVVDTETARSRFSAACALTRSPDPAYWLWTVSLSGAAEDAGIALLMASGSSAEIGMLLLPEWHGLGLGTGTVRTLTEYGFNTLEVGRIEARQRAQNVAWQRLMERNGFELAEEAQMGPDWLRWRRDRD